MAWCVYSVIRHLTDTHGDMVAFVHTSNIDQWHEAMRYHDDNDYIGCCVLLIFRTCYLLSGWEIFLRPTIIHF